MGVEPRATYRLQLHREFGFSRATEILPYLAALGISHVYCSPYFQAAAGSAHGYDVVDPTAINTELGGEKGLETFRAALKALGLGEILDIVPNHMAAHPQNRWWRDVLELGRYSRFARHFDIDWEANCGNKLLLPVLGDRLGNILERRELAVASGDWGLVFRYYDLELPLSPDAVASVLNAASAGSSALGNSAVEFSEIAGANPSPGTTMAFSKLRSVLAGDANAQQALLAEIEKVNSNPSRLFDLHEQQAYQLAFWRRAAKSINYRRFFDINGLVSVRVEDPEVFLDSHTRILEWLRDGSLEGVRVDHPDGLNHPGQYFERLRNAAPAAWILAEKILEPGEALDPRWPIDGTTGYDFANEVGGLFVHPDGEAVLTGFYQEFTGEPVDFAGIVEAKKSRALAASFPGDLARVARRLEPLARLAPEAADYDPDEWTEALGALLVALPVYRTYLARGTPVRSEERECIRHASECALERHPGLSGLIRFIAARFERAPASPAEEAFISAFQQLSGPLMAKGVEDTAFYCFNRLISSNEVGGNPGAWGTPLEHFHARCQARLEHWPKSMLSSSTHDTKRGEDVRLRIHLLSEMPGRWASAVRRWSELNARHKRGHWPDHNLEYLFYQTIAGARPISAERLAAYVEKAAREAGQFTSWTEPNPAYEEAAREFVQAVLSDAAFQADMDEFVRPLLEPARAHSLALTLIKLTAPGVPDIYQGSELWNLSLVDPDNRRPVDYAKRRQMLEGTKGLGPEEVWARHEEGLPKLWLIQRTLDVRRRRPEAFGPGATYEPVPVTGSRSAHLVAYSRGRQVIVLAPRWILTLNGDWRNTQVELPPGRWTNVFTGEIAEGATVEARVLFERFPVALLEERN